jgi:hypothetical protein
MRILEGKNWKRVALDRDEMAKLLKKARGPPRSVEPMMIMIISRWVLGPFTVTSGSIITKKYSLSDKVLPIIIRLSINENITSYHL